MINTRNINDCWNLCETNSIMKCAAISYNHSDNTCYLYNNEFFKEENFSEETGFTTFMKKSTFILYFTLNKIII